MTTEVDEAVRPPVPGVLDVRDLRRVLGDRLRGMARVAVVVLAAEGAASFIGEVRLGLKRAGRGAHVGIVCPRCEASRLSLLVGAEGELACRRCLGHLTRAQRESKASAWRRCGGREEDALIRLIRRSGASQGAQVRARALVRRIRAVEDVLLEETLTRCDGVMLATAGRGR